MNLRLRLNQKQLEEAKAAVIGKENEDFESLEIQEDDPSANNDYKMFEQMQVTNVTQFYYRTAEDILKARPRVNHTKKRESEDEDEIYLSLFDRSERTIGATFTKSGNALYSTPTQRIGAYMDYSANLKRSHLLDIISYLKTSAGKHLSVADKSTPLQYLNLSLFHGCMKEEPEMEQNNELYDPLNKTSVEILEYKKPWTKELEKEVKRSQKRYLHYISKDEIQPEDISLYNKQWMEIILKKVNDTMLEKASEVQMRDLYQDIVDNFTAGMKRAIVNYILRSPVERKRLNIAHMPRTIVTNSEIITYTGGYNISKQPAWNSSKNEAVKYLKANLLVNNVIMSSLQSWFQDFRALHLLYFKNLSSSKGPAIAINEFLELEKNYRRKVKGVFKHIWYRGAILILYKLKYLKNSEWKTGRFTLNGYAQIQSTELLNENVDYAYLDNITKFSLSDERLVTEYTPTTTLNKEWDSLMIDKEEFADIRESEAYQNYVSSLHGTVNYDEDGYKSLSKEFRTELKYSAGNLLKLQMRAAIERTLELITKYFKRFETAQPIVIDLIPIKKILQTFNKDRKDTKKDALRRGLKKVIDQICGGHIVTTPIWRIGMKVENKRIKICESEEFIILGMLELIDKVCNTFNKFVHPDFTKIKYLTKEQLNHELEILKNREQMFIHLNDVRAIKLIAQNVYQKFCGNVRIAESKKLGKCLQTVDESKSFFNKRIDKLFNVGQFMKDSSKEIGSKYACYKLHIQDIITKFYEEALQLLKLFHPFKRIINESILEDYKKFIEKEPIVLEEYTFYIEEINELLKVLDDIPTIFYMTMFEVDASEAFISIKNILNEAKTLLKIRMEDVYKAKCQEIIRNYERAEEVLRSPMTNPSEVQFIEAFKSSLILDNINWKESTYIANKILFTMFDIDLVPTDSTLDLTVKLHYWPKILKEIAEEVEEPHRIQREKQEQILKMKREIFEAEAMRYGTKIAVAESFREIKDCKKVMETISQLDAELNDLREQRRTINSHEKLLFDFESSFDFFNKIENEFSPYCDLWKSVDELDERLKSWFRSLFSELDIVEMERQLKEHVNVFRKSQKFFEKKTRPAGFGVTLKFGKEIEEMQKVIPMIEILANPGLKRRHWERIQEVLGVNFDWKNVSVKDIMSKGIELHKDELVDISELAGKEFALEKSLSKMKQEWEKQEFVIITKPESSLKLFSGSRLEEMQLILDEHIVIAQQIRANPFVAPMEREASCWEKKLLTLREVIDKCIKMQIDYLYLHPIFDSEDIIKRLPAEATKFANVNEIWNILIELIEKNKKAINVDELKNLIQRLDEAQADLDSIAVNLNNYLEDKRKRFPRFYFLANDDMYDILGDTKNPKKIETYLKKLFEGVKSLIFAQNLEILGIKSAEGEQVNFIRRVVPEEYHGSVENMLIDVEREMKNSVSKEIEKAVEDYSDNRLEWLGKNWPGQVILAVSQLIWSQKIAECISHKSVKELSEYLSTCESQLKDCVKLIRKNLDSLQQIIISALIVLDVHANDILDSLIANNVTSETAFEWLAQLRYHYDFSSLVNSSLSLGTHLKNDHHDTTLRK